MENKKLWFKAKLYGWGWVPCSWEGWSVVAVYAVLFVLMFKKIDTQSHSVGDTLYGIVFPSLLLIGILIAICYWKGEKPRWRWGK